MLKTDLRRNDLAAAEAAYRKVTPKSAEWHKRALEHLPGGVIKGATYLKPYPMYMDHAEGCYIYDVDGRRYLDFANHHTAMVLGHGHPAVVKAVEEQVR